MKYLSIVISVIIFLSCNDTNNQEAIASCLEKGGSWNYEDNKCDFDNSNYENVADQNEFPKPVKSTTKGLILPKDVISWISCCIYIPQTGLKLYQSPNGKSIGKLRFKNPNESTQFFESEIAYLNGDTNDFEMNNFEMVGYEVFALKFIASDDSFVQLENNLWVKKSELNEQDLTPKSWIKFAIEQEDLLGWYGNNPGIELKQNPGEESELIKLLEGDLFQINLTHELKGEWVKVNVHEYQIHPCDDPDTKPIQMYSGWIKLISDEGTLNVWNYTKGC